MESHASALLHQGWVTKQSGGLPIWKRRWFVLAPPYLECYRTRNNHFLKRFDVSDAIVSEANAPRRENVFQVATAQRVLMLSADSPEERDEWVKAIRHFIILKRHTASGADFKHIKVIDDASRGNVTVVRHRASREIFALKSMRKAVIGEYDRFERAALLELSHPFIVSTRYLFETETTVCFVMQFMNGGNLFSRLREEGRFTEERARLYAAELVLAIAYLHGENCVHRNLKAGNVLFDENGHARVSDFGLVTPNMMRLAAVASVPEFPTYMAPELVNGEGHTVATDWWAAGVLIFEMMCGYPPFDDGHSARMSQKIVANEIQFPPEISPIARDFINRLCAKRPQERLGFAGVEEIQQHPFFNGIDWAAVLERRIPMPWVPPAAEDPGEAVHDDLEILGPDFWEGFGGLPGTNASAERRIGAGEDGKQEL
jgi:serine/threonine protein kinase